MIGSGEDSGFKKSNTINRRMFIFAAAKAVVFFGIVGRVKSFCNHLLAKFTLNIDKV